MSTVTKYALAMALRDARAKIVRPDNWTRHALARTSDSSAVSAIDPNATCFCMLGAVFAVAWDRDDVFVAATDLLREIAGTSRLSSFNDNSSHEVVIDTFARAIAQLEAA